jgi:hypothetical protein
LLYGGVAEARGAHPQTLEEASLALQRAADRRMKLGIRPSLRLAEPQYPLWPCTTQLLRIKIGGLRTAVQDGESASVT